MARISSVYSKTIVTIISILVFIFIWITVGCEHNIPSTPDSLIQKEIFVKDSVPTTVLKVRKTAFITLKRPISASAVSVSPDGKFVAAVNPDSDSITLLDPMNLSILAEIPVGDNPRTVSFTPDSGTALVTNNDSGTLSIIDVSKLVETSQYSVGLMPYGAVSDGIHAFITEFGSGTLSVFRMDTGELLTRVQLDAFPAGITLSRDTKHLFITHFFTGQITIIDQETFTVYGKVSTGADINLSQFIAVTADGLKGYLPQTRSNTTNTAMLFDTTVFPVINVVDLVKLKLLVGERITLDTADEPVNMPFAVVLSPEEQILYLSNAGSDDISVIDLKTNRGVGHIKVGANPRGIAITPDGSRIFVNNVLDGTLSVINGGTLTVIDTVPVTNIPIGSQLLLGKKLFNAATEPTLTTDNWISCATCHFDGTMDTRTWLGFPDGPRNTPPLFGVADTLPNHWSGDFDELQDIEITIEEIQFGNGLVLGKAHDSLGPKHAGLSEELDALAAYLASIQVPPSPFGKNQDSLRLGKSLFGTLGCQTCHSAPLYTDLKLHDVGTGDLNKEKNSHGRKTQFDTPSLRGVWMTAPYFHDGTAESIESVLHTGTIHDISDKINESELKALIDFLQSL
jgi:YVTN family beta-propeller protein